MGLERCIRFPECRSIVVRLEYDGKSILFTGDEFGKDPDLNEPMKAAAGWDQI